MVPLGVRTAAFFGVPMVVATSASAEEKKKAAPPQSRQSRVMFAIGKRTRRGHAAWSQIDPKATLGRSALLTSVRTFGSARSGPLADLDDGVSVAGQHARACDQSMFSMRSRAFAHPPQRSRGRPDSAGNVKKADLLRVRVVERMNRLGGRLQQDRATLFRKIRLSFRR